MRSPRGDLHGENPPGGETIGLKKPLVALPNRSGPGEGIEKLKYTNIIGLTRLGRGVMLPDYVVIVIRAQEAVGTGFTGKMHW